MSERWKEPAMEYAVQERLPHTYVSEAFQAGARHGYEAALEEAAELCIKTSVWIGIEYLPWEVGKILAFKIRALANKESGKP